MSDPMFLEVRTYRLKPGTRDEFVRTMLDESVPLLQAHGIRVIAAGASLVDEDGAEEAYLMRAFPSLEAHREQEASFYASDIWLNGPRERILATIESYHSVVIEVPNAVVTGLSSIES